MALKNDLERQIRAKKIFIEDKIWLIRIDCTVKAA